jgi:hypothetical protein
MPNQFYGMWQRSATAIACRDHDGVVAWGKSWLGHRLRRETTTAPSVATTLQHGDLLHVAGDLVRFGTVCLTVDTERDGCSE